MASWEDELDLDLSDIWAAGSKPVQEAAQSRVGEDRGDDLAFPTEASAPCASQPPQQSENVVTRLYNPEVADAPTQVAASLTPQPVVVSGGALGATQNSAPRDDDPKQQSSSSQMRGSRNPNPREKAPQQQPVDIRKYFTRGSNSSGDAGPRKKPRIPGPVGDLVQRDQRYGGNSDDGDGDASGSKDDDFNDEIFRRGAWISALQSLNVDEFDPARYAILKVTASSISSRTQQQVPHFVAVIKELTPNIFGDAAVLLKDPTGTVAGMMNNKVFSNTDYGRAISPGAVIVLKQVAIFSPSAHYLNITINNVVQVFAVDTDLPQGSKAPEQQQQEPQPQPPQPQPQPPAPPAPPPLPPQPKAPEGITAAAKMAGWDLIDDMEALLNEDVDDFYA